MQKGPQKASRRLKPGQAIEPAPEEPEEGGWGLSGEHDHHAPPAA